jgi:SAM-dependent methyltransferase
MRARGDIPEFKPAGDRAKPVAIQALTRFLYIVRRDGLIRATGIAARAAFRSTTPPDEFDSKHGTDTAKEVPLWKLSINSPNLQLGVNYQTLRPEFVTRLLSLVPPQLPLVDLGCGKGRILIIAHELNFHPVTGVEFSNELAGIAKQNLDHCGITANLLLQDAAKFNFTSPTVLFMYNPFGESVMREVASKVRQSSHQIHVVYVNCKHLSLFAGMSVIHKEPGTAILMNH